LDGESNLRTAYAATVAPALSNGTATYPVASERPVLVGNGAILLGQQRNPRKPPNHRSCFQAAESLTQLIGSWTLAFLVLAKTTRSPGDNIATPTAVSVKSRGIRLCA
jgi:hypothetical protein